MQKINKLLLYYHTVKSLKPVQIRNQIKRRLVKAKTGDYLWNGQHRPVDIVEPSLDFDEGYIIRFDVDGMMNGEVELLHERHRISTDWTEPSASHLWNYNLQYLEFTIPLAVRYKCTGDERYKEKWIEIVSSWIENSDQSIDSYESYTISMRIPNILIGLGIINTVAPLPGNAEKNIYNSLYSQYKYLQENLELHLLANHYFENLKCLVICTLLFEEDESYHHYFDLLLKQIDEQILSDGLHYERSIMYHKIIIEDVIRVYKAVKSSGRNLDAEKITLTIRSMAKALGSIERGFDRTPLFNDAGDNVSKSFLYNIKHRAGVD